MDINYFKNRIGSKFFTYVGDDRKEIRVIGVKNDKVIVISLIDMCENDNLIHSTELTLDELEKKNYVEVIPDAKLDLMITSYSDETKKDVYAWVYRMDNIIDGISNPSLMLRQDMIAYSKNTFRNTFSLEYVGDCITDKNNPTNASLVSLADFSTVDKNYTISLYISDKLNDIMLCIDSDFMNEVNSVLHNLTKYNDDHIQGYCDNLLQLFKYAGFIGHFRSVFNITQVDFEIDPQEDDSGTLKLTEEQQHKIEDLLSKYITNVIVIKYDADIDLKEIVEYKHIIISDITETIYLIAFDVVDNYPVDSDIAKAFGLKCYTKEDMEKQLGIKL